MRVWLLIIFATVCNVASIDWQPLLAQGGDHEQHPVFLTKDDIANVRNVFRTLKLTFKKQEIARIFGPDAAGDITTMTVSVKRTKAEIETIEILYRTFSEAEKTIPLDKQHPDFKALADNIDLIERN